MPERLFRSHANIGVYSITSMKKRLVSGKLSYFQPSFTCTAGSSGEK
uniref:Uncharacterized protein n=1 Tax=Ascaris lumbricoides TaxID=6252 RepID=A0A0M3HNJ2_ASCLU